MAASLAAALSEQELKCLLRALLGESDLEKVTQQVIDGARAEHINPLAPIALLLIQITASISVSVGMINLLPVPTLDGGHLLFYGYELVTKHPPRAGIQAVGFRAGLALLVSLMLFVAWNDLQRLQVFQFLGSLFS